MKFYNRDEELKILNNHYRTAANQAILDVFLGRRRVGKTELIKKFIREKPSFYFFVGRKPLNGLLEEWSAILREKYPEIGEFLSLDNFLRAIFEIAKKERLIAVFDEFQNFKYVDPSAFSIFQKLLDHYKNESKMMLILIGSIVTMMGKIFSDKKEPLFGRATRKIYLAPFDFPTVCALLKDLKFKNITQWFDLYSIFGGIPKYYSLLKEENLEGDTLEKIIIQLIAGSEAVLRNEGEDILKEEFGREYGRYFEILSLIARGQTKLSEIANSLKLPATSINAYLSTLEKKYKLIERRLPVFEKPRARLGRYFIKDIFLTFWFRFIYRYLSLVEKGASPIILRIIKSELTNYQGRLFEELSKELLMKQSIDGKFVFLIKEIGGLWSRQNESEVDIAALSEAGDEIFLGECKINPKRINHKTIEHLLAKSAEPRFEKFKKIYFGVITLGKVDSRVQEWLESRQVILFNIGEMMS